MPTWVYAASERAAKCPGLLRHAWLRLAGVELVYPMFSAALE